MFEPEATPGAHDPSREELAAALVLAIKTIGILKGVVEIQRRTIERAISVSRMARLAATPIDAGKPN
jgi:hypothetical protein